MYLTTSWSLTVVPKHNALHSNECVHSLWSLSSLRIADRMTGRLQRNLNHRLTKILRIDGAVDPMNRCTSLGQCVVLGLGEELQDPVVLVRYVDLDEGLPVRIYDARVTVGDEPRRDELGS